jgi:hypothetical protein
MDLIFSNVETLGISQEVEKFDSDFNFSRIKTISVSGLFLDLQNTEGVKNITEASELFIKSTKTNLGAVLINGVNYGDGYVSTFDLEGEQIRTANYSAEIIIRESESLSDIALRQNEGADYNLSTNTSGIVDEDLKFLTSFSESFNFSISEENNFSLSHDITCSFGYRESIITNNNTDWTGSISGGRSTNLGNRGKGSIKINGGLEAYLSAGQLQSGVTYIVEFEYLGQYINKNSWTDVSLYALTNVNNKNNNIAVKTINSRGIHKLEFTPDVTGEVFLLLETLTNAASFDNVRLYKKNEMPLEKSKALSELLFNISPYYAVLESNVQNKQADINLFDNFTINQSFDDINLEFSASKNIDYASVKVSGQKKYSVQTRTSKSFQESGIVSITENIEIKALKNKTESALREYINYEKSLVKNRIEQSFSNYESFIDYDCPIPTNTKSPVSFSEFSTSPITQGENIDLNSGTASLTIVYSNDPTFNENYFNENSTSISESEGNNLITISGTVIGIGDSAEQRFNNARSFPMSFTSEINKAKQNNSLTGTFNLYSRSIQSNKKEGSIQYNWQYSDSDSLEKESQGLVKSYDIQVSTKESGLLYNEFSLGCSTIAQVFRDLRTPEELKVEISMEGFFNATVKQLYDEAKVILLNKNLLFGEDSKQAKNWSGWDSVDEFLTSESFSFSEENKTLSYNRTSIKITCPPTLTPGLPSEYGYNEYSLITPTPDPTPTPIYFDISAIPATLTFSEESVPTITPYVDYVFTPIPITNISTDNPVITPTPVQNPTPTPTATVTPTPLQILRRITKRVPEDWNDTIANLLPGADFVFGNKCVDDGKLTDAIDFAERNCGGNIEAVPYGPHIDNLSSSYLSSVQVVGCNSSINSTYRYFDMTFEAPESFTLPNPSQGFSFQNKQVIRQDLNKEYIYSIEVESGCPIYKNAPFEEDLYACTGSLTGYTKVSLPMFYGSIYDALIPLFSYPEESETLRNAWSTLNSNGKYTPNQNVELIAYQLPNGTYKYVQPDELDKPLILSAEFNDFHPNFLRADKIVTTGNLLYKNCSNETYQPHYQVHEFNVPSDFNLPINSQSIFGQAEYYRRTPGASGLGGYEFYGLENCSGDIEHTGYSTKFEWQLGLFSITYRTDYEYNTLIDGCNITTNLPQINKIFSKQMPPSLLHAEAKRDHLE